MQAIIFMYFQFTFDELYQLSWFSNMFNLHVTQPWVNSDQNFFPDSNRMTTWMQSKAACFSTLIS